MRFSILIIDINITLLSIFTIYFAQNYSDKIIYNNSFIIFIATTPFQKKAARKFILAALHSKISPFKSGNKLYEVKYTYNFLAMCVVVLSKAQPHLSVLFARKVNHPSPLSISYFLSQIPLIIK